MGVYVHGCVPIKLSVVVYSCVSRAIHILCYVYRLYRDLRCLWDLEHRGKPITIEACARSARASISVS